MSRTKLFVNDDMNMQINLRDLQLAKNVARAMILNNEQKQCVKRCMFFAAMVSLKILIITAWFVSSAKHVI